MPRGERCRGLSFNSRGGRLSEREAEWAEDCHQVRWEASAQIQEKTDVMGAVRGVFDKAGTVTMDLGRVPETPQRLTVAL